MIEEPSKYGDANKMDYNYFYFIFIVSVAVVVASITIALMLFYKTKIFTIINLLKKNVLSKGLDSKSWSINTLKGSKSSYLRYLVHLPFESLKSHSVNKTNFFESSHICMSLDFEQKKQMENIRVVGVESETKKPKRVFG